MFLAIMASLFSFGLACGNDCGVCKDTGQNYYPVLNEVLISPDGTSAALEFVSCKSDPWVVKIKPSDADVKSVSWDYVSMTAINNGISVLQQIPIADRLILVRTPVFEKDDLYIKFRETALIAEITIPQNNNSSQSYQRIPDITGPFVWAAQSLGYPNNQSII
jgi:hypothetical protein